LSRIAERYEVEREVGRGGMATVSLAHDHVHDRKVAIKLLRPEFAGAVNHERFLRETRMMARLQHPHIVPIYDSGTLDGVPYYVMPYVEGESLRARLDRARQLPTADAVRIAMDVASALQCAHQHGIVHRDIKPENILLSGDRAVVADFGIAHAVAEAAGDRLTSTGLAIGTPSYMSPEQASGDRAVGPSTDLYSLGCVLFEMLAGIPPFVGATPQAVIARRLVTDAPSVRELRASVPAPLADVVARSLERAPADRFPSADAMAVALGTATIPTVAASPPTHWRRVGTLTAIGAALAGVALVSARSWRGGDGGDGAAGVARGMSLVSQLRLDDARHTLRATVARHPADPLANLWLAQAGALVGHDSAPEWRHAAEIAVQGDSQLQAADRLRAEGLVALATNRLPDACDAFTRLVAKAPADLSARLTLADCIAHDDVVVPDSGSPSGWRFRQSAQHAVALYEQLVQEFPAIEPLRARASAELGRLLKSSPNSFRSGHPADGSDRRFGAFPSVAADTIAYIPYPVLELDVGRRGARAASEESGLAHHRELLRDFALDWVRDFPNDPVAHQRLALALENTGEIVSATPGAESALDHAAIARRLSRSSHDDATRLRLALLQTRLLVKARRFADARALADTILASWTSPTGDELPNLASVAALVGRIEATVDFERRLETRYTLRSGETYVPPPGLAEAALECFAYAALGGPPDSVVALRRRVEQLIPSYTSAKNRASVRDALLSRSMLLAAPLLGAAITTGMNGDRDYLLRLEQDLATANRPRLASEMTARDSARLAAVPGATTFDAVFIESWVRASAGDTLEAERELDASLDALPASTNRLLEDIGLAASLPRMMVLRVELGASRHEAGSARAAQAVCDLWAGASAALQPVRLRMCAVAQSPVKSPPRGAG